MESAVTRFEKNLKILFHRNTELIRKTFYSQITIKHLLDDAFRELPSRSSQSRAQVLSQLVESLDQTSKNKYSNQNWIKLSILRLRSDLTHLCNGLTSSGANRPCNVKQASTTANCDDTNLLSLAAATASLGVAILANSDVKNACSYLVMPPCTFASIVPCNRMEKGLMLRVGSAVYCDIRLRSSRSVASIVSQANCWVVTKR